MATSDELDDEARDDFRRALLDESYGAARMQFLSTILGILVNIEDWFAIDSWITARKAVQPDRGEKPDPAKAVPLWAVATVASMSTELADAAVAMVAKRRYYAVGAVIRQLIECEYLLVLFNEDLDHARRWGQSTPAEIRNSFSPKQMRTLTGKFSNEEYWGHCDTGGHPVPKGARLLEKLDPMRRSWPISAAELSIDLGLHLRRIWKTIDSLLVKHHVRYQQVRADQRQLAEEAWVTWRANDPVVEVMTASDG
ncbi:hypothetical protein [Amycolatopsis sp. La24]|uniref:hypothetical protein n=1 Tax=Amycolatopsis sp. La24 TaxID=3028304 RepID=UPI0023AEA2C0|nr:hypothetical protein [Amycolatopsis sp. La24]